ncbi:BlaI/MecI/CopY family transcriptional regulator [Anaerovorax odorimutans]|uniref:BlaI/MecI/CopY family transcriptional regulator n=1 Tax=Anaerovorax odorimutans TaxID=109327 RepID=UPI000413A153|nr:BlaI/MecI/CopY family transcriptional regulator [Anaerovorax odorimutans]
MKRLPSSQLEIMLAIWQFGKAITRKELHKLLEDKNWKITTLNTLLNRLVQNEFLEISHQGKEYVYYPRIMKEDYLSYESKYILSSLYENSMKNFFASMCNARDISTNELSELQQYLEKLKGGDSND